MIPRVFHRIWFGGKPLPEAFARWGEGWLRMHPGWTMKLWTERESQSLENADLFQKCSSLAQRSDIARYEILYREGGVYLDTDMECLKNIEPLIQGMDCFACWQKEGVVSNAVIGSIAGHRFLNELVRRSRTDFQREPWNAMGPPFFASVIRYAPDAVIFERKTFTPYTRAEYEAFPEKPMTIAAPPAESYAINHRSSVWHPESSAVLPDLTADRAVTDAAQYWHYHFQFPWGATTPTKPGWADRVEKRKAHFFWKLIDHFGGTLEKKTVLDLGCCQGYWSFASRRAGASSVLGIDSCPAFIQEARSIGRILGIDGCSFVQSHLEEQPWWSNLSKPSQVTLILGVLYHLKNPVEFLRQAMMQTAETLVIDGEVVPGAEAVPRTIPRNHDEPTTVRSSPHSESRTVLPLHMILGILRDGGFQSVRVVEPSPEMPADYQAGTTVSIIASR